MLVEGTERVKKTQLISLISLIATNVFCLVALSVAWFAAKRTVDNAVNDITAIDASGLSIDYKVYGYDETNAQAGVCKSDDPTTFPDPLALSDYDAFISSRNKYTNILVRVEITFSASTANKGILLTVNCSSTDYTKTETKDGKTTTSVIDNISNVIQFKCAVYSHTIGDATTVDISSIDETSAAKIYSTASEYFDTVSTSYSFVNIASTTSEGTTTYTYTKPSTQLQVLPSTTFAENCDSCVLYLELDYNPKLIEHYLDVDTYSTEGASSLDLITQGNQVSFSGDLSSMMVGIGDA